MAATLYGHAVETELPLPRVRHGSAPRGTLRIRRASTPPAREGEPAVRIDDRFTVHRRDGSLVVWCERSGTFALDVAAGEVETEVGPGGPAEWEHRLACVAIPLLLAERGDLALHASAVATEAGAVVLCGRSGRGKSTAAWALAERGFPALAEDGTVITPEGPLVWPSLTGVRLREPSGERPIADSGATSADPVPLAAVAILGARIGDGPRAQRLDGVAALTALMPHGVHARGPSQAAAFRGAGALVRSVPVYAASLPDDLARVGEHAEALLSALLPG